jgi:hypothetical protein
LGAVRFESRLKNCVPILLMAIQCFGRIESGKSLEIFQALGMFRMKPNGTSGLNDDRTSLKAWRPVSDYIT